MSVPLGDEAERDDDEISITSTIEEEIDSETDFDVDKVLSEGVVEGQTQYLIKWTGYELHDATWEPRGNLDHQTLADWKAEKKRRRNGTVPKFKVSIWKEAVLQNLRAKHLRHKARNQKRRRLGLDTTKKEISFEQASQFLDFYPSDDQESQDENAAQRAPRGSIQSTQEQLKRTGSQSHSDASRRSSTDSISTPHPQPQRQELRPGEPSLRTPQSSSIDKGPHSDSRVEQLLPSVARPQLPQRPLSDTAESVGRNASKSASNTKQPVSRGLATRPMILPNRPAVLRRTSSADTNVFAGGKVRKKRSTLLEAAVDPSQKPQFLKSRHQRLIEKGLRDKEGTVAPAILPSRLITLRVGPENLAAKPAEGGPSVQTVASPDSGPAEGDPAKNNQKKRKSVHWDDGVDAAMDLDAESSLFVRDHTPLAGTDVAHEDSKPQIRGPVGPSRLKSPPLPPRLSSPVIEDTGMVDSPQDTTLQWPSNRDISKMAQIGSDPIKTLDITFFGMPDDATLHWLSQFKLKDCLVFAFTCTAKDFSAQPALRAAQFYEGSVSSHKEQSALEALAERLKIGSLGVFSYQDDYCVLLYPSKSEDWNKQGSIVQAGQDPMPLRYLIFKPSSSLVPQMLAPVSTSAAVNSREVDLALCLIDPTVFGGVSYERLVPSAQQKLGEPHFFLAFPEPNKQEAILLSQWLRHADKDCKISVSDTPGHWSSFVKLAHGIVIIHEDAVWAVRRFPEFLRLLRDRTKKFAFWLLTRGLQSVPLFPRTRPMESDIGDIRLTPIFPKGMAILITPSFLTSQPEQAYHFVKWFRRCTLFMPGSKLVACAGIDQWLFDLGIGEHPSQNSTSGEVSSRDKEATTKRVKTAIMLRDWSQPPPPYGTECTLVSAPESIDGHDEQSLVNWFGYWSVLNMNRFRDFVVLGSGDRHPARNFSTRLKTPIYRPGTTHDPEEAEARSNSGEDSGDLEMQPGPRADSLQLVPDDSADALHGHLNGLLREVSSLGWFPVVFYKIPISYWSSDMAFHFRDYRSKFATYDKWFRFWNIDRTLIKGKAASNTTAGFFYTIDGNWDSRTLEHGKVPSRSPWFAFYRPVQPHIMPWRESELLIWDLNCREKFSKREEIYEGELPEAQHQLIRYIGDRAEHMNIKVPLRKVWLGGFDHLPSDYHHPIDITLFHLREYLVDLKMSVPIPAHRIPERGWKLVKWGPAPLRSIEDPMEVDEPASTDEPGLKPDTGQPRDLKMVFHPPRGNGRPGPSRCKNWFYLSAKEAVVRGKEDFEYLFRPTMEWYLEQLAEGRGFEHIQVASWETIFKQYDIPEDTHQGRV